MVVAPADKRQIFGQVFTPPDVAELTLSLAGIKPGMRVLDPACGDGEFLVRASARGAQVTGLEIDPMLVAIAQQRVPSATVSAADFTATSPSRGDVDAVVGNPPYVRHDRVPAPVREALAASLAADFPAAPASVVRRVARGDLAAGFFARSLAAVVPGGTVALVVSSALLDADYADALWTLCSELGGVEAIVDAPRERWFGDAAVNAVVMVARRTADHRRNVAIARLRVPTERAVSAVTSVADLPGVADVRVARSGIPARWASLLRASSAWLEIERAGEGALCALGDVAKLWRGLTTGANDLFYVSRERAAKIDIEPEALVPLVRAPRAGDAAIRIDPESVADVVIACPPDRADSFPRAAAHFAAHVHRASAPTLRNRRPWWALTARPARVFLTKAYAQRFVQRLAPEPMVCDQRLYAVEARSVEAEILAAVLSSTFTSLAIESLGRASMGEGALELSVGDAAALPIIDPRALSRGDRDRSLGALKAMWSRPVGPVAAEAEKTDRQALDLAIARAHPALAKLLPEVRAALTKANADRIARARAR